MTLLRMAIAQPERVEAMVVVGVGTYLPAECRAALAGVNADDLSAAAWEGLRQKHLHGDRDYCFPASMAQEIYEAIPDAYLWVVPNGTHVPIQGSRAGPFARNALAFLAESWEGD